MTDPPEPFLEWRMTPGRAIRHTPGETLVMVRVHDWYRTHRPMDRPEDDPWDRYGAEFPPC